MVAAILIGAVIAILGAMAASEVIRYSDYPWVDHTNILPILFLILALGGFLALIA
tara:strand:- start:236 stop:400 length:165 start_codon:yes stop_codon:yes gene_type:complete